MQIIVTRIGWSRSAGRHAAAVVQRKSTKLDVSAIINVIRFQRDSCKFQEDFRANISCDSADARKSGRRRIIRWWLMAIQPKRCTCNANLIRCTCILPQWAITRPCRSLSWRGSLMRSRNKLINSSLFPAAEITDSNARRTWRHVEY